MLYNQKKTVLLYKRIELYLNIRVAAASSVSTENYNKELESGKRTFRELYETERNSERSSWRMMNFFLGIRGLTRSDGIQPPSSRVSFPSGLRTKRRLEGSNNCQMEQSTMRLGFMGFLCAAVLAISPPRKQSSFISMNGARHLCTLTRLCVI
jgi:hypothetical protein